jgi:hypothetical protein
MLVTIGRQLRQVGDAHHLVLARKVPQLFTDHHPDPAPDPLVNFVKYQGWDVICLCQNVLSEPASAGMSRRRRRSLPGI